MTYKALVSPIDSVSPIKGADRIVSATVSGYTVVVGKDTKVGTLGVLFPPDGQLSYDMLNANRLYATHPSTGEKMGGYFGASGRVRAQSFKGVRSEGFWTELKALAWTGIDISTLKEGDQFDTINGKLVCQKYETSATLSHLYNGKSKKRGRGDFPLWKWWWNRAFGWTGFKFRRPADKLSVHFKQHFETEQLKSNVRQIPEGAVLWITSKCHGTSARTGLVKKGRGYSLVSGTRRVVLNPEIGVETGYYSGKRFRYIIHQKFSTLPLRKGEVIYYEIVGFDETGKSIMPPINFGGKGNEKLINSLGFTPGQTVYFSYGCEPAQSRILVYRITMTDPDGNTVELPWYQVLARCKELGLEPVPPLAGPIVYDGDRQRLIELCTQLAEGREALDPSHLREGVCIRVEHPSMQAIFKLKQFAFLYFEGVAKDKDTYVDPESVA